MDVAFKGANYCVSPAEDESQCKNGDKLVRHCSTTLNGRSASDTNTRSSSPPQTTQLSANTSCSTFNYYYATTSHDLYIDKI